MTKPLDAEELARLRALAEAASPAPWTIDQDARGTAVYDVTGSVTICRSVTAAVQCRNDAAFIAAAREAVPALLDALERAEAVAEAADRFTDALTRVQWEHVHGPDCTFTTCVCEYGEVCRALQAWSEGRKP